MSRGKNSTRQGNLHGSNAKRAAAARADIVAIGLNATDTLIRVPRFPAFDSKTKILSSSLLPGGQAASAAVACQRWDCTAPTWARSATMPRAGCSARSLHAKESKRI